MLVLLQVLTSIERLQMLLRWLDLTDIVVGNLRLSAGCIKKRSSACKPDELPANINFNKSEILWSNEL